MTTPTPAQVEAVAKAMYCLSWPGEGWITSYLQDEWRNKARVAIAAYEAAKEKGMSKLDELIEWNDRMANRRHETGIVSRHRDTADALRLLRDVADKCNVALTHSVDADGVKLIWNDHAKAIDTALTALRATGLMGGG